MHVSILQENLLRSLTRTGRTVSPKAQLPIMQNVLLQASQTKFSITATSLEMSVISTSPAKIEKDGGICISSRLLTDLVVSLPQDTVQLVAKEGSLHVRCGGVNATIPGVAESEFPPVAKVAKKNGTNLEKKTFLEALSGVLFAAATDEGRPLLTGVKLTKTEDGITVVATDGYRLSKKNLPFNVPGELDIVIPARALSEVVRTSGEEKETDSVLMIQSEDGQLVFLVGETEIHTRAIAGDYPNIEKIIPKTHNTRALVDAPSFTRAVKSAAVFARDNANILKLHVENQSLVVSANTPQVGENHVEVEAKIDGDGGDIAFNSRFLTEFLNGFTTDEVMFEMTGSLNPGVFKKPKDESYLHIIMPVRVQT